MSSRKIKKPTSTPAPIRIAATTVSSGIFSSRFLEDRTLHSENSWAIQRSLHWSEESGTTPSALMTGAKGLHRPSNTRMILVNGMTGGNLFVIARRETVSVRSHSTFYPICISRMSSTACKHRARSWKGQFVGTMAQDTLSTRRGSSSAALTARSPQEGTAEDQKPSAFRILHQPRKGKPGARLSVSLDHQNQKNQHDTVRPLRALVNDASIVCSRRLLADPDTGKLRGVSRIYGWIFWLDKNLFVFERAKFTEWKARQEASGDFNHTRIADHDITISVNWESL